MDDVSLSIQPLKTYRRIHLCMSYVHTHCCIINRNINVMYMDLRSKKA